MLRFSRFQFWVAFVIALVGLVAVIATILSTSSTVPTTQRAPQTAIFNVANTLEVWGMQQFHYPQDLLQELELRTGHRIVLASADRDAIVGDSQDLLIAEAPPPVSADAVIDPLRPQYLLRGEEILHGIQPDTNSNGTASIVWMWLDPPSEEPVPSTTLGLAALIGIISGVVIAAYLLSTAVLRPVHAAVHTATRLAGGQRAGQRPRSAILEFSQLNQALDELDTMLAEAAERRRALADDLAHEIRSPLTSALGRLRGVNEGYFQPDEAFIEGIIADLELLNRLVGDLRTTTQAEQQTLDLNLQPLDLAKAIQQAIDTQIPERTVDLDVESIQVEADPNRLQQILRNLLTNADRYSPLHGAIEIEAHVSDGCARATVRDHGPGIAPGDSERIFERFYRDDKARSKSNQSTGLGLTIARSLAWSHEGDLTASNHADGGAIFTLTLPLSN